MTSVFFNKNFTLKKRGVHVKDNYIENVLTNNQNLILNDYLVLLTELTVLKSLISIPQKQVIIYIYQNKDLYITKISIFSKFDNVQALKTFHFKNVKNNIYPLIVQGFDIEDRYKIIRLGNKNIFSYKSEFIEYLESKSI